MFRNLAITVVTGVLVACCYAIAFSGPVAAQPAVVDTSGIELAPSIAVAVAPAGVVADLEQAIQTVAQAVTGKKTKTATASGKAAMQPEEKCYECCGCGCCGCGCCGCSCSCEPGGGGGGDGGCSGGGGGGGCGGFSCVQDDSPETPASVCGASDSYDPGFDDNRGRTDVGPAILEQTACTPAAGETEACTPFLVQGHTPPDDATCSTEHTTVDPPKPTVEITSGSMSWQGQSVLFDGQESSCNSTACKFDEFSWFDNGNNAVYDEGFVCN